MQTCRLYKKNRKNEPLVGSCFTQCSAFWKDTLKTEARFAIDSALGVLKEKLEKNDETVDQNANRGLYALWKETPQLKTTEKSRKTEQKWIITGFFGGYTL